MSTGDFEIFYHVLIDLQYHPHLHSFVYSHYIFEELLNYYRNEAAAVHILYQRQFCKKLPTMKQVVDRNFSPIIRGLRS